jgi:hypothetical protein
MIGIVFGIDWTVRAVSQSAETLRDIGRWSRVDKALNKANSGGYLCHQVIALTKGD